MTYEARLELIRAEYFTLQSTIEAFDAKALQFKGWSVTATLAAAAAAMLSDKIDDPQRILVLALAAFGSLTFWLTEALWKQFQQAFYGRLKAIEAALRDDRVSELKPLQISASWSATYHSNRRREFVRVALWPHTFLPHLAVSVFCVALMVWLDAHPTRPAPPAAPTAATP